MRKHKGFTLVELVVVVMILGILAAVAAPKLLNTSANASDNGIKQSLAVVRDAIERYAAENGGALPGQTTGDGDAFKTELAKFLRGEFPKCPVAGMTNDVLVVDTATTISGAAGNAQAQSWKYSNASGQFIVNSLEKTNNKDDDTNLQYDQL